MVAGSVVGHVQMKDSEVASGEAATALRLLERGGMVQPATENVLLQSRRYDASDPAFVATIASVVQTLALQPNVTNIQSPMFKQGGGGQISHDGHSVLVRFDVRGDPNKAASKIKPILDAVAGVQLGNRDIRVREVGNASANYEIGKTFNKDFASAERLTIPLTLLILLGAFGALVAAGLPVLLAFSAVLASLGLFSLVTHVSSGDYQSTSAVILLIGMAVGVDYSLFYLRREREERSAGEEPRPALIRAAATSGQAVLISGITVLIAMAGMFIASNKIFTSMAFGTMLVVFCAMVGSLTVLPAVLARLGDRVDRGHISIPRQEQACRHRVALLGLRARPRAPPTGGLDRARRRTARGGRRAAPWNAHEAPELHGHAEGASDRADLQALITAFPGAPTPADVVVEAPNIRSARVAAGIRRLELRAAATGRMFTPMTMTVSNDDTVADIQIPIAGNGDDKASLATLATLRNVVLPDTLGTLGDVQYAVTGETAGTHDFNQQMKARMPWVFAFVLGLAFVLLLATFRSVVIPLTAIVLNLLSVGAAYGLLVLIFQHDWADGVLGFTSNHAITSWLPMFLFVVLFGLSMDYHVFILSRIKELRDGGLSTEEAVSRGIRRTAGTVTSAAIIMVAVFAIFGTLRMIMMKQLGVGLGLAVLIDATVIRGVLLPATMKLLGEWNWYMPTWLEWLPSLTPETREARRPRGRIVTN